MNILKISNEAEAWALLERTLKEGLEDAPFELVFENWPSLEFKLQGAKFDSSLTVPVMQGFIDLQQKLNRAYVQMKYDKPTARNITATEKEELQIVVHVDKGSSLLSIDLNPAIETFIKGAANNMTGGDIVTTILGVALIYGGATCFKAYLNHRREIRQVDTTSYLSEQETKRMEVFADAISQQKTLAPMAEDAIEAYNSIIKGASEAETLEIGGVVINQEDIQELVREKRTPSEDAQLNGMYRIQKIDNSKPDRFMISLLSEKDGRTFTAKLEDKWVFRREANVEVLETALFERKPVYLRVNGKELRGEVKQAVILDVEGANE